MKCLSLSLALAGLCATAGLSAQTPIAPLKPVAVPPQSNAPVDETPRLWFVELRGAPLAELAPAATVRAKAATLGTAQQRAALGAEKQSFRAAARNMGLRYSERFSYDRLFNGFSISMDVAQLDRLKRLPGVKAVYPVETIAMPEPQPSDNEVPELATSLSMIGADIAHSELGLDGTGIQIAVMDTGIDIDHPDFGGTGEPGTTPFPNARIVAGWDFVGDDFNADPDSPTYNPIPVPDPNPDDCGGHGSHVAGIVGADGEVTGVAPKAKLGAYRVFGCEGSTTADIMIAAMERVDADGMDVLNMSIGSAFQWPTYPTAQAASRLARRGVVVVASIGNNGPSGLYAAGAPGVGADVIGTASFDNTHNRLPYFTVSPDAAAIGFNAATGAPPPPTSGSAPLARTGTPASVDDACSTNPPAPDSLTGKIALVRRGTCSFYEKSSNAQAAGAIGVVLYNNVPGRIIPTVAGDPPITIPVVAVSDLEGVLIDGRLAEGAIDLTWTDQFDAFPNPLGGLISSFSSYGLAADLSLKPDIGAPGGGIFSTFPLEAGGYATLGGTSMASPHVAGASALYLQAYPNAASLRVRDWLQNSASPKPWWGNPSLGLLDNVHRQGAGMLRIDGAILATTQVRPGKLTLGESELGPQTRTLTIRNTNRRAVNYSLSFVNALSTGANTFVPTFHTSDASVSFSADSISVPAHSTRTVDVTITPATAPDAGIYGGYVEIVAGGTGETQRVPFAGYIGDYQAKQVLVPTANGFPWLAKRNPDGSYTNQPGGATYTLVDGDIPYFAIHLDHQARRLRLTVIDAITGRNWHRAVDDQYLGRNSSATGFFAFAWDGTTIRGGDVVTVPNGRYIVQLSVLKALGDPNNLDHWETWTSPEVRLARP